MRRLLRLRVLAVVLVAVALAAVAVGARQVLRHTLTPSAASGAAITPGPGAGLAVPDTGGAP
jgi:hypothetical protein